MIFSDQNEDANFFEHERQTCEVIQLENDEHMFEELNFERN